MLTILIRILLTAVLILYLLPLYALDLGDLNIFSAPGEPFRAEIRVENLNDEPAGNVRIGIPAQEQFIASGVPYHNYLPDFLFRFRKINADIGVIDVRNRRAIADRDVAFLISVNWSSGGVIREYSVVIAEQANNSQNDSKRTKLTNLPAAGKLGVRMDIVAGDNLENVAEAVYLAHFLGSNVTVAQIMTAIRRNNAQALASKTGRQSYQLKTRTSIAIPDRAQVTSQNSLAAQREINTYYRSDRRNQRRHAGGGGRRPPATRSVDSAQVRLLTDQSQGLEARAALQQERISTLNEELSNLASQAQFIDQQIADVDNVIEIKSAELLQLKQRFSILEGNDSWLDNVIEFFDLLGVNPILWALLAVLAIIIFIVLRIIFFPSKKSFSAHDFGDDSDFVPQFENNPSNAQRSPIEVANAFIDMGNIRQAKIILREVLSSGTPAEQQQAHSMLDRM